MDKHNLGWALPLGSVGTKVPLISVCLLVVGKMPIYVMELWHLTQASGDDYTKTQDSYGEPGMGRDAGLMYVKRTPSPCISDR